MKKAWMVLLVVFAVFGFSGAVGAALTQIGTATYGGQPYNLIYEGELGGSGLVWLDYTKGGASWQNQVNWASGLGGSLTVTVDPAYTTGINWSTGWRLPSTVDGLYVLGYDGTTTGGYNITTSEMGHLYYASLMNKGYFATDGTGPQPGWGLTNTGPFNKLQETDYFSGTEYSYEPGVAWYFYFGSGRQGYLGKVGEYFALAVRPGEVSAVPVPASVFLFASGLLGLLGLRRRLGK